MSKWLIVLLVATTGCLDVDPAAAFELGTDGVEIAGDVAGGSGGNDVLPKSGMLATDPTILSVRVSCSGEYPLFVAIQASDPGGSDNLATCTVSVDGSSGKASFGRAGVCAPSIDMHCRSGQGYVVDVTISNIATGKASASVTRLAVY